MFVIQTIKSQPNINQAKLKGFKHISLKENNEFKKGQLVLSSKIHDKIK